MMLELEESLDDSQRGKVRERIVESRDLVLALMPNDIKEQLLADVAPAR